MTNKQDFIKLAGTFAPLLVSMIVVAAQWGSVTTKMQVFETRLDKIIETNDKEHERTTQVLEKTNDTLVNLQKDMSYIRGKMMNEGQ